METAATPAEITRILQALGKGEKAAEAKLIPLVYAELRRLAKHHMAMERQDHTLQSTALVHEAYIRLTGQPIEWQGRAHFFALAATMMRRILVDHARAARAARRGAGATRVLLQDSIPAPGQGSCDDLIAVHEALNRLQEIDPRQAHIVELRFFAGLDMHEIGELLGLSSRTIRRDWESARAWLYLNLKSSAASPSAE
jgi:RNA polymerase sigma factor (TIGR02999 family)